MNYTAVDHLNTQSNHQDRNSPLTSVNTFMTALAKCIAIVALPGDKVRLAIQNLTCPQLSCHSFIALLVDTTEDVPKTKLVPP